MYTSTLFGGISNVSKQSALKSVIYFSHSKSQAVDFPKLGTPYALGSLSYEASKNFSSYSPSSLIRKIVFI
jgi:hypothetical protein